LNSSGSFIHTSPKEQIELFILAKKVKSGSASGDIYTKALERCGTI